MRSRKMEKAQKAYIDSSASKAEGMKAKRGFSLIELLIVMSVLLIIAAIAIPSLFQARLNANEASAVQSMRSLNTACATYTSTYGKGYPGLLTDLGPASSASPNGADLIDSILASGIKSGYTFTYTAGPRDAGGVIHSYTITGEPIKRGATGQRGFYTDNSFVVRVNLGAPSSLTDPPIG